MHAATKVFDCFLFNDEVDLLVHRLRMLSDVVDEFVVVEAPATFQGRSKPLHFEENRRRFAAWDGRVRHVVADQGATDDPWEREHAQHRAFERALEGVATDDDLVLVGDCDELPLPAIVRTLASSPAVPTRLHMANALYWADTVLSRPWTDGTVAFRWRDRDAPSLGILLGRPGAVWGVHSDPASITNAGWHVGHLGDLAWIERKLRSFSHTELLSPAFSAQAHLARCIRLGVDYQSGELLRFVPERKLPAEVRTLGDEVPGALRAAPFPLYAARLVYAAFTVMRRRLPPGVTRAADVHPRAFLAAAGVPLLAAHAARALRRAMRR